METHAHNAPRDAVLATPRLQLRPLAGEDVDRYHAILTDPGVRRFLLDDTVVSRTWVIDEIARSETLFRDLRCGTWLLREHTRSEPIGFCGFRNFYDPPELQLFYGLLPQFWGRGLAAEAGRAVIRYAFDRLGFAAVIAATDPPNVASVRLLERLGMTPLGETVRDGLATLYFRLERPHVSPAA